MKKILPITLVVMIFGSSCYHKAFLACTSEKAILNNNFDSLKTDDSIISVQNTSLKKKNTILSDQVKTLAAKVADMQTVKLTSVVVSFTTPSSGNKSTDDKDDNSAIDITIYDGKGSQIASNGFYHNPPYQKFTDHDYGSRYDLDLAIDQTKTHYPGDLNNGSMTIKFTPVGHDTWYFYANIMFIFSDGSYNNVKSFDGNPNYSVYMLSDNGRKSITMHF